MTTEKEDELIIKDLVDILLQVKVQSTKKLVVPFIGAGMTSAIDNTINTRELIKHIKEQNKIPNWVEFKLDKASQYSDIMSGRIHKSCDIVAKYIIERKNKHVVTEFIPKKKVRDKLMHNPLWVLANLPIPIYITTNYDTLLEEYLKNADKTPNIIVSNWMGWFENDLNIANETISNLENAAAYKDDDEELKEKKANLNLINWKNGYTADNPVVFHLHGVIDSPETMVLTEDNYIDFLVRLNSKEGFSTDRDNLPVLPSQISKIFSANHLLFLGYSLNDINLNVLLRSLRQSYAKYYKNKPGNPYAVQRKPDHPVIAQWILEEKIESGQTLSTDQLEVFHNKFIQWVNKVKNGLLTGEDIWRKMNQELKIPDLSATTMNIHEIKVQEFITAAFIQQKDLKTEVIWGNVISFLNSLYEEYIKRSQP